MDYPEPISQYLQLWAEQSAHPLCLEITREHEVVAIHGPAEFYRMALKPGDDARKSVPFLTDYPWNEQVELPLVTDPLGNVAHVHLLPGNGTRFVIYFDARQEMADRVEAQQRLHETILLSQQQERLVNDLIEARSELETRRRAAEDESRRQSEYLGAMSHDFRTPLTSILGSAEWIREHSDGGNAKASTIVLAARHLLSLVDNLLDNARLDAGGLRLHPTVTELQALVDEVASLMAPLAAEKSLSFAAYLEAEAPCWVVLDSSRLRQILINLLANAIKFTDSGSVRMTLRVAGEEVQCKVCDTGPGIAAADQERVFQAFERAKATSAKPGAGLGLSNSRHLAELMGGSLTLSSALEEGTTISVVVPASPAANEGDFGKADAQRSSAPTRLVLMAEDDDDIRDLVRAYFEREGFEFLHAPDGAIAVELAAANDPDLLILDMNLPEMSGPDAAMLIRQQGGTMPIIALSAAHDHATIEQALAAGCNEFVAKPMHLPDLIRIARGQLIEASRTAQKQIL